MSPAVDGLHAADEKGAPGSGGQTAYWRVADLDAARARLLSLGGQAHRRVLTLPDGGRITQVLDPFGNTLGLMERPGQPGPAPSGRR